MNGNGNGHGHDALARSRPSPGRPRPVSAEEADQAVLRRRVMHYAEQMRRMSSIIHELSERTYDYEDKRLNWYEPELVKLKDEIARCDDLRSKWFEPQLESRQQRIAHLEETAEAYEAERHSYFAPAIEHRDARIAELEQEVRELQAQLASSTPMSRRRSRLARLLGIAPR